PDSLHLYRTDGDTADRPRRFYLQANQVVLHPTPASADYSLRLTYFRRPPKLVATSSVLTITSISDATLHGTRPSGMSDSTPVDVVRAVPHFDSLVDATTPSSTTSNSVTLSAAPAGVAVGDYVCLAGETAVPQLPA